VLIKLETPRPFNSHTAETYEYIYHSALLHSLSAAKTKNASFVSPMRIQHSQVMSGRRKHSNSRTINKVYLHPKYQDRISQSLIAPYLSSVEREEKSASVYKHVLRTQRNSPICCTSEDRLSCIPSNLLYPNTRLKLKGKALSIAPFMVG